MTIVRNVTVNDHTYKILWKAEAYASLGNVQDGVDRAGVGQGRGCTVSEDLIVVLIFL